MGVSKNDARVSVSKSGAPSEELDPRFQKILELQAKAAQGRKSGQRRRASHRADEKMPSYKLPEIVIVQNGGGGDGGWVRGDARVCVSKNPLARVYNIREFIISEKNPDVLMGGRR